MKKLVFVRWYCKSAVYLEGELVWFGENDSGFGFLNALGFRCESGLEVPTHNIPKEFDTDPKEKSWWNPPKRLETLLDQFKRHNARMRAERISSLEKELKQLKAEK